MCRPSELEIQKLISQRICDLACEGLEIPVDPDIADVMGAFEETALSPEEADAARFMPSKEVM